MNKNLVEIVSILDKSGSMRGLEKDTIGGYNDFVEKQKSNGKETRVTLVLFDDDYDKIYDNVDINAVKTLDDNLSFPRGSTALLDAIGKTINSVGERLNKIDEKDKPCKVIVNIVTNGEENSSREFTYEKIKEMVKVQQDTYSWEFIFIGANINSFGVAGSFGMNLLNTTNYKNNPRGIRMMFCANASYNSDLSNSSIKGSLEDYLKKEEEKSE